MLKVEAAFGGFTVDDLDVAKQFYGETLGLTFNEQMGGIDIKLPDGSRVWIYAKDDHQAAGYTTLNFVVANIDEAVDELVSKGVKVEHYPVSYQDEKGIMRGKDHDMGPNIAWFKDPAGNILSVLEP